MTWRLSTPPLDPGSGVSFLAFHPTRPGVLYCGSFRHPFRSMDGGRYVGADRDRHGRGHRSFRDGLLGRLARRVLGGDLRLGLPDDGRRRELDPLPGRPPRPAHARRADGPPGPGSGPRRDDGRHLREPRPRQVVPAALARSRRERARLRSAQPVTPPRRDGGRGNLPERGRRRHAHRIEPGLAEARVSAVALRPSGRVVVARAADGRSGGLWEVDPASGEALRLAATPPSTVLALAPAGAGLLAATPDGIFRQDAEGAPFQKVFVARDTRLRGGRRRPDARGDGRGRLRVA